MSQPYVAVVTQKSANASCLVAVIYTQWRFFVAEGTLSILCNLHLGMLCLCYPVFALQRAPLPLCNKLSRIGSMPAAIVLPYPIFVEGTPLLIIFLLCHTAFAV